MGTTAQKGAYLLNTKSLLKQAINNIGGEVTDETTFREYVNQLENAYDRLPKTEFEEGESVTLENTLKGKLDFENGKVGYGQTSQENTNGYQLIDRSKGTNTFVHHGVTTTFNLDGSVTMKGKADASVNIDGLIIGNWGSSTNFIDFDTSSQYVLKLVGNTNSKLMVILVNGNSVITTSTTTPSIFTPTYNGATLLIVRYQNATQNEDINVTVYPMISKGNDTTYPFEQYSGGYASPSPNWEQQVKCVAGKNKFNKNTITHQILNENGVATDTQDGYFTSDFIEIDSSKQYTKTATGSIRVKLYDSGKNAISTSSYSDIANFNNAQTFSIPYRNAKYIRFTMNGDYVNSIQIEERHTSYSISTI